MNMNGITPPSMDWESSNLPEAWERFKRHTELIFKGPLNDKTEEEKIAYVLLWAGDKGRDVHQTWRLSDAENKSLKAHYDKFQAYVQPKLNPIFARFKFYNEVQGSDPIDKFVTRLRLRAQDCQFRDNMDEMIRDRLVIGTNDSRIREKLINEGEKLTLDKALQIAQSYEYCQKQMVSMSVQSAQNQASSSASSSPVDAISKHRRNIQQQQQPRHHLQQQAPTRHHPQQQQRQQQQSCGNCGKFHGPNKSDCRAFGKQCRKCGKLNHFAHVCRSQQKSVCNIDNSSMSDRTYSESDSEYCGNTDYCIDMDAEFSIHS